MLVQQGITAELTVPAVSQNDQLLNPEVRGWGEGSEMPLQKASLKASHMAEQEAAVCSVTHPLVFPLPLSLPRIFPLHPTPCLLLPWNDTLSIKHSEAYKLFPQAIF